MGEPHTGGPLIERGPPSIQGGPQEPPKKASTVADAGPRSNASSEAFGEPGSPMQKTYHAQNSEELAPAPISNCNEAFAMS